MYVPKYYLSIVLENVKNDFGKRKELVFLII